MGKLIGKILGTLLAIPFLLQYALGRLILGRERAFASSSEWIAQVPGHLGVFTRQAFYHRTAAKVGRDVYFGYMSLFSKPAVEIGNGVYIGRFCVVGWAELGDEVMLADGVQVLSGRHQHGPRVPGRSRRDAPQTFTKVTIGSGAWIGAEAIVMADVGAHAVVGAGAVVVKTVPEGATVGGVPAKLL